MLLVCYLIFNLLIPSLFVCGFYKLIVKANIFTVLIIGLVNLFINVLIILFNIYDWKLIIASFFIGLIDYEIYCILEDK